MAIGREEPLDIIKYLNWKNFFGMLLFAFEQMVYHCLF